VRYLIGFLCVCALGLTPLAGCNETTGDGGTGGAAGSGGIGGDGGTGGSSGGSGGTGGGGFDDWFWGEDCPGCRCEEQRNLAFTTTFECFCCRYHCEPGLGPFGRGTFEYQRITDYDCDRRSIYNFQGNPSIEFVIDTTTNEVVAATYDDDSGICGPDGQVLRAGEDGLGGCEKISERECDGPCGTGGSGGAGGNGGDVGAFDVQP